MPDISVLSACTPLTEQQRDLQLMVRELAAERVAPLVAAANAEKLFPREILTEMGKLGLLGGLVPGEYTGMGLDHPPGHKLDELVISLVYIC